MAASFDGTPSTLETPFDNETHETIAIKQQIAKIPPQQTEWDTSNIVSGTSLAPSNVGGGYPNTFRVDQIPWSLGEGTWWPLIAPLISTSPEARPDHVEASNVYGGLSNAYLETTHLVGTIPAAQVSGSLTNASIDYSRVTNPPTTIPAEQVYGYLTNASIDYSKVTNPPATSDILTTAQNISFLNTNQLPYYSSNYFIDEWQDSFKCFTNTINTTISNTVYAYRLTLGAPDMAYNFTSYAGVKILQNTGIEADKLVGKIAAAALPNFLTPIITYDVTSNVPAPAQGNSRTLIDTMTNQGYQTYEMDDEFRKLYGPTFSTDQSIIDSLNLQILTTNGYKNTNYPFVTDFSDVQSLTVHNTVRKSVFTSNMRFSLAGFKNFQADAVVSSNVNVHGDVNVTGNLAATTIVCGGVKLGASSGASSSSSGGDTAISVLGMIFGAVGAAAGVTAYLGSKGAGAVGPPGADGLPGVMGPPGPAGVPLPMPTLRELIDAALDVFKAQVNIVLNDYLGGDGLTENILKLIINAFEETYRKPLRMAGKVLDLWNQRRGITDLIIDIVTRCVQSAQLQAVLNPQVLADLPAAAADVVIDVVARNVAYIMPNADPNIPLG